jgi:hypothetical protein
LIHFAKIYSKINQKERLMMEVFKYNLILLILIVIPAIDLVDSKRIFSKEELSNYNGEDVNSYFNSNLVHFESFLFYSM